MFSFILITLPQWLLVTVEIPRKLIALKWLRSVFYASLRYDFWWTAIHFPAVLNVVADRLSRLSLDKKMRQILKAIRWFSRLQSADWYSFQLSKQHYWKNGWKIWGWTAAAPCRGLLKKVDGNVSSTLYQLRAMSRPSVCHDRCAFYGRFVKILSVQRGSMLCNNIIPLQLHLDLKPPEISHISIE